MPVIAASKTALGKLEIASFDLNCLAIDQSVGQLLPGRFQYTMKGRPGNPHSLSTRFLFQSLQILKTDRLKFLKRKTNTL